MAVNDKLKKLYLSKWDKLQEEFEKICSDEHLEVKPTNPLLLKITDNFEPADIKIMIFGQETNGWYEESDTLDSIINCYDRFFNDEHCYSYGGQFWNGFKRFVNSLQDKYPSKTICPIWNNIVKIGCSGQKGLPPDYIYDAERNTFSVIKQEIEIIKPDIVLFLTGPYYDNKIEDNFGKLTYHGLGTFSERQLAKIDFKGVKFAFRTYHPNYLWRYDIDSYFDTIIEEIKI